jgi:hypothetical protein
MRENGLRFAPAVPGDEAAYRALHSALVAFDTGISPADTTPLEKRDAPAEPKPPEKRNPSPSGPYR